MKADIKDRWIEALTSGEFIQAKGCLIQLEVPDQRLLRGIAAYDMIKNPTPEYSNYPLRVCHCCLGVLCELYERETGQMAAWGNGLLPIAVMHWAELNDSDPVVMYRDKANNLMKIKLSILNDSDTPFATIAGIIREQL